MTAGHLVHSSRPCAAAAHIATKKYMAVGARRFELA